MMDILELFKEQRTMELNYEKTKAHPDPTPMTLDLTTTPTCFEKVKVTLSGMQGSTGIPLSYVIRTYLQKPYNDLNDLPWGYPTRNGPVYSNIDKELIMQAPILGDKADRSKPDQTLEIKGTFHPAFSTDMKKV